MALSEINITCHGVTKLTITHSTGSDPGEIAVIKVPLVNKEPRPLPYATPPPRHAQPRAISQEEMGGGFISLQSRKLSFEAGKIRCAGVQLRLDGALDDFCSVHRLSVKGAPSGIGVPGLA